MRLDLRLIIGFFLLLTHVSFAKTLLSKVESISGSEVKLSFNSRLDLKQVTTDYINDMIQLTFNDTNITSAKVMSVHDGPINKIFIYQYSPKVVRCRLTVRGNADAFKDRLRLHPSGSQLSLRILEAGFESTSETNHPSSSLSSNSPSLDERILQEKVMQSVAKGPNETKEGNQDEGALIVKQTAPEKPILGTAKPLPSIGGVFLKLGFVVTLLAALVYLLSKFSKSKNGDLKGILGVIQKLTFAQRPDRKKMIEVISTQYLGPKKSLTVVRVAGRHLVLGVTQDSISLLIQLTDGLDSSSDDLGFSEGIGESKEPGFSDFLNEENPQVTPNMAPDVRSRIRSRLEGLKPL